MTSRELVIRTLEFDSPSRIPQNVWTLPWAVLHHPADAMGISERFPSDITGPGMPYPKASPEFTKSYMSDGVAYRRGTFTDEWGSTYINYQDGVLGEVKEPLIQSWDDLDKVRIPEEYLEISKAEIDAFCTQTDKFVLWNGNFGEIPRPFERIQFLRGPENLYMDLADQPPGFFELLNRIHEYYLKLFDLWTQTKVDAVGAIDDWGSQRSLLISPATWRKIFKPLYKEYADLAHKRGKYFFFHSDGYIRDIYPDLIEIGFNAINSQIFCMDIEDLGRNFCGKVTFWGEIDRQHILPNGTAEDVVNAVKRVKENLYADGGVIAQCEFGAAAKPENVSLVFETWENLGAG